MVKERTIRVRNLSSEMEAEKLNRILHEVFGIRAVEVNLAQKEVKIKYNEDAASFIDFEQAIVEGGFDYQTE